MKKAIIAAVLVSLFLSLTAPVSAQSANPRWATMIAYFNPGQQTATLGISYLREQLSTSGSSQTTMIRGEGVEVGRNASGVINIDQATRENNFRGSAIVSTSGPIASLYIQQPTGGQAASPVIYNAVNISQFGSGDVFIPYVRLNSGFEIQIGVQNLEEKAIKLQVEFFGEYTAVFELAEDIEIAPKRSLVKTLTPADFRSDLTSATFIEGSLRIIAYYADGTLDLPRIVASVKEIQGGGVQARAFETVGNGFAELVIPTAVCATGTGANTSLFAIQNVTRGSTPTFIQVQYYQADGTPVLTQPLIYPTAAALEPGQATRFDPCDPQITADKLVNPAWGSLKGKSLTAIVRGVDQAGQPNQIPLGGVVRVQGNNGLSTAYTAQGLPEDYSAAESGLISPGHNKYYLALPFVEFSKRSGGNRTYFTIVNPTGAAAKAITAHFYGRAGGDPVISRSLAVENPAASQLAPYARRNLDPLSAGAIAEEATGFTGAVVLESDIPLIVTVRVQREVNISGYNLLGDDYNGVPFIMPYISNP